MNQKYDGIVMFSGGLDSMVTAHLLKSMGLRIVTLHYVLPFYSGFNLSHRVISEYAALLDIPLRIEEEGPEFMEMVKTPHFGFGKNANPCLDCRIHRLIKAKTIMKEYGAAFIATGEVIGQRPKSQRLECLHIIEKRTGLDGRLLRPLSAKLLPETIPEQEGLVDRSKLMDWHGRSRKPQLAYAREHNLKHDPPAGGCLLTHEGPSKRYHALADHFPEFVYEDFLLIAYGRHFLLTDTCRLVVARDDYENGILEKIVSDEDIQFEPAEITGPLAVLRGKFTDAEIMTAAGFVARYSRARNDAQVAVRVFRNGEDISRLTVVPADPAQCDACRF